MKKLLALLFLVSATCVACDPLSKLDGIVIDQQTGQPLMDVTVKAMNWNGAEIITDSLGYFCFSSIDNSDFILEITKEGYRMQKIEMDCCYCKDTLRIALEPSL